MIEDGLSNKKFLLQSPGKKFAYLSVIESLPEECPIIVLTFISGILFDSK